MSNYHITQEQAREIRDGLVSALIITPLTSPIEDATNIVNAVLDKVLGEPIYLCVKPDGIYYELDASEYDPRTDLILYAPKELL